MSRARILAASLVFALAPALSAGCAEDRTSANRGADRWATTEDTRVAMDWDALNAAYKAAEGPEDLERRVNEIYKGDEVISIAVHDVDERTQVVTGFFDRNTSGTVDEGEKVFTITRAVTGEGEGTMQTVGYGPYMGYHSPVMSLVTGMLLGSMISRAFMPGYAPMYRQPYTTPTARRGELRTYRNQYRAQNPSRFQQPTRTKPSSTGRSYGGGRSWGGGRTGGGGRFGIRGRRAGVRVHLDA